jgi:hypothetical protein
MLKKTFFHIAAATVLTLSGNAILTAHAEDTSGTVLETMNAAGYTYIYVDSGAAKEWVAVPQTELTPGDKISYSQGMEMKDFYSKSLDRSFPTIIFSAGIVSDAQPATAVKTASDSASSSSEDSFASAVAREKQVAPAADPAMIAETSGGSTGAIVPFAEATVEKATGENSYTVEEVFAKAKELNGKSIRLRGKVVKFSANIMGRNWVHLQDGTGNPMNNTHDLVVTTAETVADDEIIMVEGKLAADKDFGAGYKYDAIIEEAIIIK